MYASDKLIAFSDQFILTLPFQITTDIIPEGFQKFDLPRVGLVPFWYFLLLIFKLLLKTFDSVDEVLLDEGLLLSHLHEEFLHFEFDEIAIFAVSFDFVIESGQFIQYSVLVLRVYFVQMGDVVSAMLPR